MLRKFAFCEIKIRKKSKPDQGIWFSLAKALIKTDYTGGRLKEKRQKEKNTEKN